MFSLRVDTVGGSDNTAAVVPKAAARELKRLQTVETLLPLKAFFSSQIKTVIDVWKISRLKKRAKIVFNAQVERNEISEELKSPGTQLRKGRLIIEVVVVVLGVTQMTARIHSSPIVLHCSAGAAALLFGLLSACKCEDCLYILRYVYTVEEKVSISEGSLSGAQSLVALSFHQLVNPLSLLLKFFSSRFDFSSSGAAGCTFDTDGKPV